MTPSGTRWTEEKIACLREHWKRKTALSVIEKALGIGRVIILTKADELGLGERPPLQPTQGLFLTNALRAAASIKHRASLRFSSPIRLRPSRTLIGAPIRTLDSETRALIDAALAARGSP